MSLAIRLFFLGSLLFAACLVSAQVNGNDQQYMAERPGRRIALVLANWKYAEVLPGPEKDGVAIRDELRRIGFDVTYFSNFRTKEELEKDALMPFLTGIGSSDFAVIYFTGHGLSPGSESYLVHTKVPKEIAESKFLNEFISIEEIHRRLAERSPGISVVILDACRSFDGINIVYGDGTKRKANKGLATPSFAISTTMAIVYAAQLGQAAVVKGDSSIFTDALVQALAEGTYEYDDLKRSITNIVAEKSDDEQRPWYSDSPTAIIRFRETVETRAVEKNAWLNALADGTKSTVRSYLRLYPTSRFAHSAREWLRDNNDRPFIAPKELPPRIVAEAWEKGGPGPIVARSAIVRGVEKDIFGISGDQPIRRITMPESLGRGSVQSRNPHVLSQPIEIGGGGIPKISFPGAGVAGVIGEGPTSEKVISVYQQKQTELIGIPISEGYARIDSNADSVLVNEQDVETLIASVTGKGLQVYRASIETGAISCGRDSPECIKGHDKRVLQALHVERLLNQNGVGRGKITTLFDVSGIPNGAVRIRLFSKGDQP